MTASPMKRDTDVAAVTRFWRDAGPEAWFRKDDAFDARFRARFMDLHLRAAAREFDDWIGEAEGALALMILLDQFPRNCFRGTAHMFATDPLARALASDIIAAAVDAQVDAGLRSFVYLPFMHSESIEDQDRSVALYQVLGGYSLPYAIEHRDIIAEFGRFPHRNEVLGRRTTDAERAFLERGGLSG